MIFCFQYKNNMNASRAFIFHQLKIPVVAEIGGSFHHIMGDETAGYLCYSENSWYEAISLICKNKEKAKIISDRAYYLMKNLYDPFLWCKRFKNELEEWLNS